MGGALKIAIWSNRLYSKYRLGWAAQLLKNINRIIFGCDISYKASIAPTCKLPHQGLGVVIGAGVEFGDNCIIAQNTTFGGKNNGEVYGTPKIGNNVLIGAGACLLGNIQIGSNVRIGANAVVLNDVPDNVVVVGVPAKVIKEIPKGEEN